MWNRSREATLPNPELTPVQRIERYAELLLVDPEGNERVAVAERILPSEAESGNTTARAEFTKRNGGYFIDEYRNHGEDAVFTSYVVPADQMYDPQDIPAGATWATGMIRHRWHRFSIRGFDDIEPVVGVLKTYFGELPE